MMDGDINDDNDATGQQVHDQGDLSSTEGSLTSL